jgi:hypothetical protein
MTDAERSQAELTGAEVADWLRRRPDFLEQHPDVLTQLDLPGDHGVASLLQRQVELLRDENQRLKRQLTHLSSVAGENERLMQRLHRLSLQLVAADDVATLFDRLDEGLRADFRADAVCLVSDPSEPIEREHAMVQAAPDPQPDWLNELLGSGNPLCGRLTRDKREAVFGAAGAQLGSAALVPLTGRSLLAIGAESDDRFHPDMGTLFLELLRDTLRYRLALESGDAARRRARA